jgi:hypothetical protein
MQDHRKIVWLASYPKSGNTWFRVFLSNLLNDKQEPVHINELKETSIASARGIFDEITGLPSEDLTHEEIDELRPEVYRWQAGETDGLLFKKVHDAYTFLPDGRPLFPAEVTYAAIYFIRNPLDVAVSFAHHSAKVPQQMIKTLNNSEFSFCGKRNRLYNQLRQKLGSWSEHVKSWVDQAPVPVKVLRYEDMKTDPLETFESAVRFLSLNKSREEVRKALEFSDLNVLQAQEEETGFKEKMIKAESFFRKGTVGEGKDVFTKDEIHQILEPHMDILQRFGYLSNVVDR